MEITIALALSRFATIPPSLRENPSGDVARPEILVSLASLYHHYWLDAYGRAPPDPDPAQFEYLQFLMPTPEFRIRGDGIGIATAHRRHRSNELGRAFCRWFLHDHLGITYFAHMSQILNRSMQGSMSGYRVERIRSGDTPDYFCAENVDKVFLAEAKGRYDSVSFSNAAFASWRKQFERVVVKDPVGKPRAVKGYIVATRFGTEAKPKIRTGLFAEDPESPGDAMPEEGERSPLGAIVLSAHYSEIAIKLSQPILASALANGFVVPDDILFPVVIWEFTSPPLHGTRFVGGYYPSLGGSLPVREVNGRILFGSLDPLRIDVGRGTFFGVEEQIFRQVVKIVRVGERVAAEVSQFEQAQPFYSGISVLRDGSIVAPLEFLTPVEQTTI